MNYYEHDEGIKILADLFENERLIPVIGSGFTKDSYAHMGRVPDGNTCTDIMKKMILLNSVEISHEQLEQCNFNKTAKIMKKYVPEDQYLSFFRNYFTDVKLENVKTNFINLPWPYVFTLNVDDGIESTGVYQAILPYHNARKDNILNKRRLFKLHGDAKYELDYQGENIVFDSEQYIQAITSDSNQSMRDFFSTAYKELNILFVGCSLDNEPDIKYIYNSIANERHKTKGIVIRRKKLNAFDESELEEYGITDIVLVKDYDAFYSDFYGLVSDLLLKDKTQNYQFMNPKVEVIKDKDLKYFSGFRSFDEKKNVFVKSELIIDRDITYKIERIIEKNNIVFVEGRRFSGKTSLLISLCEREKRRNIFFFPSTTQEPFDVVKSIAENNTNSLIVFDSNAVSNEVYFLISDIQDILGENNNKIIIALNQSDNFLPERVECEYLKLGNLFSKEELDRLAPMSDSHALIKRKNKDTNLDYLKIIENQQNINIYSLGNMPKTYSNNEHKLLLLLGVKDKIYSKEIYTLKIKQSEIKDLVKRTEPLCEFVAVSKGETSNGSAYKLVHNSKRVLFEQINKISTTDIEKAIYDIVSAFRHGDSNQKRIYRDVMQFDTLNQLFGGYNGAGKLIFSVYSSLEELLSEDTHFWLQRAKSIYRLQPKDYMLLKKSYQYAKKTYTDSNNMILTSKAALSISLICSLQCEIEKKQSALIKEMEEAIDKGYEAIFSDYYKLEKSELNDRRKKYPELIKNMCNRYIENSANIEIKQKAIKILAKLS